VLQFTITSSLIGIGAGFVVPLMNVWFRQFYGLQTEFIGAINASVQAATASGVLVAPALSARIGKVRTIVITQALSLPFVVILAVVVNPVVAVVSYFLRYVFMNMASPASSALRMEVVPSSWRPSLNAIYSAADQFGRSVGVQVTGQLYNQSQYLLPFWFMLTSYAAATSLFAVFFRHIERTSATSES